MLLAIFPFLTSLILTFLSVPSIVRIAEKKHLFDVPDERKLHKHSIPTMGGVAIFAGMIFSLTFWSTQKEIVDLQYIISSIMILFFMGIKDDLINVRAYKKLIVQLAASFILVHWADIRITSFFGLFGFNDLNIVFSYIFSMFTMVVITNAFNLIDGVDTLGASVGVFSGLVFGAWFLRAESFQYVVLSFSMVGSLIGFLYYNRSPAKIFMGDTGSLIIGITLSILAIKFIEANRVLSLDTTYKIKGVPVFTMGVLLIPLFDTLRVFSIRLLQGRSPFSPDRNHLHHLLIDLGFSHHQTVMALISYNALILVGIYFAQGFRSELVLVITLSCCLITTYVLALTRNKMIKNGTLSVLAKKMDSRKSL